MSKQIPYTVGEKAEKLKKTRLLARACTIDDLKARDWVFFNNREFGRTKKRQGHIMEIMPDGNVRIVFRHNKYGAAHLSVIINPNKISAKWEALEMLKTIVYYTVAKYAKDDPDNQHYTGYFKVKRPINLAEVKKFFSNQKAA